MVSTRRWSTRAIAACLLATNDASLEIQAVQLLDGSLSTLSCSHLDESEATGVSGVGIAHD